MGVTGCPRCLGSRYHDVGALTEGMSGLLCRKGTGGGLGLAVLGGIGERCCGGNHPAQGSSPTPVSTDTRSILNVP